MDDVSVIRKRIDELDQAIVQLLKSRDENARFLGRIKSKRDLEYRDPGRERIILQKVELTALKLGLDPKLVRRIFEQVFALSIKAQKDLAQRPGRILDGTRILIVGGTGGMGRFFARVLALQGAEVSLAGRQSRKTRTVARELEVEAGTILNAAASDIVILSVPLIETVRVAAETVSLMSPGSLLLDFSSVKTGISDRIVERVPKGLEYVSLHPLFGPATDHLQGQTIVEVAYRPGRNWARMAHALEASGASLIAMSASQHDRAMAYSQGLHHFALVSLGISLDGRRAEPATRSLRQSEKLILGLLDNWDTIVGIQQLNPLIPSVRRRFLESTKRLEGVRWNKADKLKKRLTLNVQKWSRKL